MDKRSKNLLKKAAAVSANADRELDALRPRLRAALEGGDDELISALCEQWLSLIAQRACMGYALPSPGNNLYERSQGYAHAVTRECGRLKEIMRSTP